MKIIGSLISIVLIITPLRALTQNTSSGDKIVGIWLSEAKDNKLEIYRQADRYYGKLVWMDGLYEADGKTAKKDVNNADVSLRSRSLLNLVVLKDFIYRDGSWNDGKIYDVKGGKTYNCVLKLNKPNLLGVRGYIGLSMFGKTAIFTRVN